MSYALLYWILMILWLIFGIIPEPAGAKYWRFGGNLLMFILLLLLGIHSFGWPIHD